MKHRILTKAYRRNAARSYIIFIILSVFVLTSALCISIAMPYVYTLSKLRAVPVRVHTVKKMLPTKQLPKKEQIVPVVIDAVTIHRIWKTEPKKTKVDYGPLTRALGLTECSSFGKDLVKFGKDGERGPLQITRACHKSSGMPGAWENCDRWEYAVGVFHRNSKRFEPKAYKRGDYEVLAKLHNCGPNWRKYTVDAEKYWKKVKTYGNFAR